METRFNGKVVPFASGASSGERTIFGDWSTSSDDINANLNADFIAGWENGLEGTLNPYPPSQYFNAALYTVSSLVSYLYQQGIPEWNTNQDYLLNSYCTASNGKLYRAKTGTIGSPNSGNNPISDTINWESLDSKFVDLISNQTVGGIKNFSSFPITPSLAPTTNYQVANKKYIDDLVDVRLVDFASSKTTNGYQKLPSGLIFQWGTIAGLPNAVYNFPIAFPFSCFIVSVSDNGADGLKGATNFTKTGFTFKTELSSDAFYYIAIGY